MRSDSPLSPLVFLVEPLSTEIMTVGGLLDTTLKFDMGASCPQRRPSTAGTRCKALTFLLPDGDTVDTRATGRGV